MVTTPRRKNRPGTPSPKISELSFHRSVAELLDWVLMPPSVWTTVPSGWGKLGPAMAGQLKACGLKPGIPDIVIWSLRAFDKPLRVDKYVDPVCICIELKAGKNTLTREQREMREHLQECGVEVYLCKTIEEVIAALDDAGIPRRGLVTHPKGHPHAQTVAASGSGIPGDSYYGR